MASIDFDLRHLEILCMVIELKSFSKAAERVFLAQASVSERIANLEKMVGVRLLDRLGRAVVPTKAGELLYKHSILLLDLKRTACLEMEDFLGVKRGEIQMGGSTIPGEFILPKILASFREKYPEISVKLAIENTEGIRGLILSGNLELGIIGSKIPRKELIHHELWRDELVLAISSQHRWAKRRSVSIEELSREPFISRSLGSGTLKTLEGHLKRFLPDGIISLNTVSILGTSTAVKEGIKSGLGVSILSSKALDTELRTGVLKILKIKDLPPLYRSFYLIRDKRRIASPLCQAMIDFLLKTENHD